MTTVISTCQQHVTRVTGRLRSAAGSRRLGRLSPRTPAFLSRRLRSISFTGGRVKRLATACSWRKGLSIGLRIAEEEEEEEDEDEGEEEVVWKRTILMGEKCQPLDFSGVIYYDHRGRRVALARRPRRPPPFSIPEEKGIN
ncbi:hypothetical protein AXF42_Ash019509 [Apostasia shenzhenica]|uniref:Uncharacterized protein n=1 Tax=Apostasia shenzhenica TaxID=1088818 RepID=A0A2I0A0A6_9ASPA|nr:hypothetical protein AXF42_Ash019509 [Apostasia shenzhenica]